MIRRLFIMALYGLPEPVPRPHGGASKSTRVALVAVMCACACLGMIITHFSAPQSFELAEEADGLEVNAYLSDPQKKQFSALIKEQVWRITRYSFSRMAFSSHFACQLRAET